MIKHLHLTVVQFFSSRAPAATLLSSIIFLLFFGWLDFITGDYSLIIFYLIPVSLATWFVGRNSGLIFSLLAIVVRVIADEGLHPPGFSPPFLHYWNLLIEFLFLLIMCQLFSALKKNLENEKDLARHDPLTGALNRRSFFDLAQHEINRSQRYLVPLTIAYIDLDNFKTVNDRFGHQAGDELLIAVASTLRSHIRSSDVIARIGGDEFVILLPDILGDDALKFLKKMHYHLDQAVQQKGWPVSFSIGAVTYNKVPVTVEEAIRLADELMYAVKHGGKNRLLHREIGEVSHG